MPHSSVGKRAFSRFATLTISEPELVRAHTVRRRVLNNEPLVVLNELEGEDMTEFYEYLERT